jgi:hypothetical protein
MNQNDRIVIPIIPVTNSTDATGVSPSVPYGVTKSILENKRPTIGEIELTLFENCNIRCSFCSHDIESTEYMTLDDMMSKVSIIEKFMQERQGTFSLLQFNIVGGELFQDEIMEQMLERYLVVVRALKDKCEQYGFQMRVVWVSNFLFEKTDEIKQFIDTQREDDIDAHMIASYDFSGRPQSKQYYSNIKYLGPEYIISVNLVGTKQSIERFINKQDDFFDWLYDTFEIYFDDFIPDKGTDHMIPSDSQFLEWYKYIADNYPKIHPVAALLENETNEMHCLSLNKLTIFPNNTTSNCRWHRYDQSDYVTEFDIHDNAGMMQRYIDEVGCLSCPFYDRCGFRCFTQWDWKNRERDTEYCPMRMFFEYITQ